MAQPRRTKRQTSDGGTVIVTAKNANGEGSLFWKEGKSRWVATFTDPNGQRREVLGKTKGEAELRRDAKRAELSADSNAGQQRQAPTVAVLVDWYLEHVDVRPNTKISYENHGRIITAGLGGLPINELDHEKAQSFITSLAKTYSPHTVTNVRARLSGVCRDAVRLGHLTSNPVAEVAAPRRKSNAVTVKRTLTIPEVHRLIEACYSHRLGAAVALLFLMGNRSSEVLGLAWEDIDLEAGTAIVRRGSTHVGKGIGQTLDDTKTTSTTGVHSLPPTVIELLRQRQKVQAVERAEAGPEWQTITYEGQRLNMVFTNTTGGLVLSQKLYQGVKEGCLIAGVDPKGVGSHTGRRTVVTVLVDSGVDVAGVASFVGHADSKTTAGYVGHLTRRPQAIADIAAGILDPNAQ